MSKPTEWRKDGWPLCPVCCEDELACLDGGVWSVDEEKRKNEMLSHKLFCYRCGRDTVADGEAKT